MRDGVDQLFRASSWQSVFEGMGIRLAQLLAPRRQHRLYAHRDYPRARQGRIAGMVEHLPTHEQFLGGQLA